MPIAIDVLKKYSLFDVFIESGSGEGNSIQCALDVGFKTIYSIEPSLKLYNLCVNRFKNNQNVKLFNGSSTSFLPDILRSVEGAVFWLDGHWCAGDSVCVDNVICPILDEIGIIYNSKCRLSSILLIDDIRLFTKCGVYGEFGVELPLLIKKLSHYGYTITYDKGLIPNDILVARIDKKDLKGK